MSREISSVVQALVDNVDTAVRGKHQQIRMAVSCLLTEGHLLLDDVPGTGKTSLATRLAESFESDLLLEGADENPFLERFYQDPRSGALPGCAAGSPTPSPMPRSRRAT